MQLKKEIFIVVSIWLCMLPSFCLATGFDQVLIENSGVVDYHLQSKKVVLRTSYWLCIDPVYGLNGTDPNSMLKLMNKINASDALVYYKDSDIANWQWNQLISSVDTLRTNNKTVWIEIGKTTLDEPIGTYYSVQYVIDTFRGKIAGIFIDGIMTPQPPYDTIMSWLLSKYQQCTTNGMQFGYYQGDSFAAGYTGTNPDADCVELSNAGLIPFAWLGLNNGIKFGTFAMKRFWVNYEIIAGQYGQSYQELYTQWYQGNVINRDQLKTNDGCEGIVFNIKNSADIPNADALNGLIAIGADWTAT